VRSRDHVAWVAPTAHAKLQGRKGEPEGALPLGQEQVAEPKEVLVVSAFLYVAVGMIGPDGRGNQPPAGFVSSLNRQVPSFAVKILDFLVEALNIRQKPPVEVAAIVNRHFLERCLRGDAHPKAQMRIDHGPLTVWTHSF